MESKILMIIVRFNNPKEVKENPITHPALKATLKASPRELTAL